MIINHNFFSDEVILTQQIQNVTYSGDIIYNKELNGLGDKSLKKMCHQVACLH